MSQLQPTIEFAHVAAAARRARVRLPGWLTLLLRNPKSRVGLVILGFMVVVALIGPLISSGPDGVQPGGRAAGADVAPPVRDDGPGQRHLLAGRDGRPALARSSAPHRVRSRR